MADTELLKQALEALEKARDSVRMKRDGSRDVAECLNQIGKAKQAIRTRLDSVQVEGRTVFPETASAEARQRLDRLVRVAREREQPASLGGVERYRAALEKISKMPDLPNPERDADWKNCMKWAAHYASEALTPPAKPTQGDQR